MADVISYGFPLSKGFLNAFVPSSLVKKKEAIVCKCSIHSRAVRSSASFITLYFIVLYTSLFIDRFLLVCLFS